MFVELHPEAETELIENAHYYEREVEGLGYRFIEDVERGIELLISQPLIGQPFNEQLRSFVLGGFPFSLMDNVAREQSGFSAAPNTTFLIDGPELDRNRVALNAVITAQLSEHSHFNVGYRCEIAESDDHHAVSATFRYEW